MAAVKYKKLRVTGGFTWIDAEDYDRVKHFSWRVMKHGYIRHQTRKQGIMLHRFVLNYYGPQPVDHINRKPHSL
jgi:hypothetical protein